MSTIRAKFPVRREAVPVGGKIVEKLRPAPVRTSPRPGRVARQLALAHCIEALIQAGTLQDYADAARALGTTRARMTQVMKLLLLAPEIQERVLMGERPVPARVLRHAASVACWGQQAQVVAHPADKRSRRSETVCTLAGAQTAARGME